MRKLYFQQIVDERFNEDLQLLLDRIQTINDSLAAMPGVSLNVSKPYRLDWPAYGNEAPHFQYRANFYVTKSTRTIPWNTIMAAINDVKPVYYKWL